MTQVQLDNKKVDVEVPVTVTVHGRDTMFFRQDCGTATDGEGRKFEMSTDVASGCPIVRVPDGRWVAIPWQSILIAANNAAMKVNQ